MPQGLRYGASWPMVHTMQMEEGLQPFRRLGQAAAPFVCPRAETVAEPTPEFANATLNFSPTASKQQLQISTTVEQLQTATSCNKSSYERSSSSSSSIVTLLSSRRWRPLAWYRRDESAFSSRVVRVVSWSRDSEDVSCSIVHHLPFDRIHI